MAEEDWRIVIPGLPNDVAFLCLACTPFSYHSRLKAVCRAWKSALSTKFMFELRSEWGKCEEFVCVFRDDPCLCRGAIFDPRLQVWMEGLPPMPCDPSIYGLSNFECVSVKSGVVVAGGSSFDARSYPMDKPLASAAVFRYEPWSSRWHRLPSMPNPRGSFACGVWEGSVIVAGGGSRHVQFPSDGSRLASVELYDLHAGCWRAATELQKVRAGCIGFVVHDEFWVIGGYGNSRTIAGVLPADEYYSDGEILNLRTGSWRILEPMWEEGERRKLGKVAVLYDRNEQNSRIFMLEKRSILRYDVAANQWLQESQLPQRVPESSVNLVGIDQELYVISSLIHGMQIEGSCLVQRKKRILLLQIYHPKRQTWRYIRTKAPFPLPINPYATMCAIRL